RSSLGHTPAAPCGSAQVVAPLRRAVAPDFVIWSTALSPADTAAAFVATRVAYESDVANRSASRSISNPTARPTTTGGCQPHRRRLSRTISSKCAQRKELVTIGIVAKRHARRISNLPAARGETSVPQASSAAMACAGDDRNGHRATAMRQATAATARRAVTPRMIGPAGAGSSGDRTKARMSRTKYTKPLRSAFYGTTEISRTPTNEPAIAAAVTAATSGQSRLTDVR